MNKFSIEEINEVLTNLQKLKKVVDFVPTGYYQERYDGAEVVRETVYETDIPNLFLKVERSTDSYGENEGIIAVKFVEQKEKLVTVYE